MFAISLSAEDQQYNTYPHAMYTAITKTKVMTDAVEFRHFAFVHFKHEGLFTS